MVDSVEPNRRDWIRTLAPLLTWTVIGVAVLAACGWHYERSRRANREQVLNTLLRLNGQTSSLAHAPELTPSEVDSALNSAKQCLSLAAENDSFGQAERGQIYRIVGELCLVTGARTSAVPVMKDAIRCFSLAHDEGATENRGIAFRIADVLWNAGTVLTDRDYPDDAIKAFDLSMEISKRQLREGGGAGFRRLYARSYDSFTATCFEEADPFNQFTTAVVRPRLLQTVRLWRDRRAVHPEANDLRLLLAAAELNYARLLFGIHQSNESREYLDSARRSLKADHADKTCGELVLHAHANALEMFLLKERKQGSDVARSISEFEASVELVRTHCQSSPPALLEAIMTLGVALAGYGDTERAASLLHECLRMIDQHPESFEQRRRQRIMEMLERVG